MKRLAIGIAKADELMFQYARAHSTRLRDVDELARSTGIVTAEGRLVFVGARWFIILPQQGLRRFRVNLPTRGARTVEVASRVRLVINLCELGYGQVMAGRFGYKAWSEGSATTKQGRLIAQEVHP